MRLQSVSNAESAAALTDFLVRHRGNEESAFLELLAYVTERGSLTDFCAREGMRIGVLIAWVRRNPQRSRRYDQAMQDRRMMDAEAVRQKWSDVMQMQPENAPRWSDVLKASEYLAKSSGALHDGPSGKESHELSEEEMQAELMELLARNPDVKHAVLTLGKEVVDAEVISQVIGGVEVEPEYGRPEPIKRKRGRPRKIIEVPHETKTSAEGAAKDATREICGTGAQASGETAQA